VRGEKTNCGQEENGKIDGQELRGPSGCNHGRKKIPQSHSMRSLQKATPRTSKLEKKRLSSRKLPTPQLKRPFRRKDTLLTAFDGWGNAQGVHMTQKNRGEKKKKERKERAGGVAVRGNKSGIGQKKSLHVSIVANNRK